MLCRLATDDHPDSRTPRSSARHRDAKTVSERNLRDQKNVGLVATAFTGAWPILI